jgi:hypothetical protein
MFLVYIDESGTGLLDRRTPIFTLGAVMIRDREAIEFDAQIQHLKHTIVSYAKPEDWEIKARDIRRGQKMLSGLDWSGRASLFRQITDFVARSNCWFHIVQIDKRELPEFVETDSDLYRLAFSRLLEAIFTELSSSNEIGQLILDTRSDLHSSIQDRRLFDVFNDWQNHIEIKKRLIGLPLFGFSAFYPGLQIADFVSYISDFALNETKREAREDILQECFRKLERKMRVYRIPENSRRRETKRPAR